MPSGATEAHVLSAGGSPVLHGDDAVAVSVGLAGSSRSGVPDDDESGDAGGDDTTHNYCIPGGHYNNWLALVTPVLWAKTLDRMIMPGDVYKLY